MATRQAHPFLSLPMPSLFFLLSLGREDPRRAVWRRFGETCGEKTPKTTSAVAWRGEASGRRSDQRDQHEMKSSCRAKPSTCSLERKTPLQATQTQPLLREQVTTTYNTGEIWRFLRANDSMSKHCAIRNSELFGAQSWQLADESNGSSRSRVQRWPDTFSMFTVVVSASNSSSFDCFDVGYVTCREGAYDVQRLSRTRCLRGLPLPLTKECRAEG